MNVKVFIGSLLCGLFFSLGAYAQTKDQTIKQLSRYIDSLESELIHVKNEIADLKSSNPKLYDHQNFIEKQERQIEKLTAENNSLRLSVERTESQLKFRSRELQELKQKLIAKGADSLLSAIEVSNFRVIPQYAKDCACFYSQDQADYNNRQFLYIEDEKKDCIININGRQERLIYKDNDTFSNKDYVLSFTDKKQINTVGGNNIFEAKMVISNTAGAKIVIPVTGVCGCN